MTTNLVIEAQDQPAVFIGIPKGSRALSPFRQAVLVQRWFREAGRVHCLARYAGISQTTGQPLPPRRHVVLASQASDLHEVLHGCCEARDNPGRQAHRRGRPGPDRHRRGERAA